MHSAHVTLQALQHKRQRGAHNAQPIGYLGMVAAAVCHDVAALWWGKQHSVASAAGLEGTRLLEELTLEEDLAAPAHLIEGAACHDGRVMHVWFDPGRCLPYSSYGHCFRLCRGLMRSLFHVVMSCKDC